MRLHLGRLPGEQLLRRVHLHQRSVGKGGGGGISTVHHRGHCVSTVHVQKQTHRHGLHFLLKSLVPLLASSTVLLYRVHLLFQVFQPLIQALDEYLSRTTRAGQGRSGGGGVHVCEHVRQH